MKRITMWLALAVVLVPMAGAAQITDPVLRNVLAVFNGADPKLLNPNWGEGLRVVSVFARNIMSQYTGPDVQTRGGGRRSPEELDAFAEALVALAIANPRRDGPNDINFDAVGALSSAGSVDPADPHRVRYEGAWDALVRIYEADAMMWSPLWRVDPVRTIEYLLGHLQEGKLGKGRACLLLSDAYDHGKITLEADGSLGFEPGGVQASGHASKTWEELRIGRFVEGVRGGHPGAGVCGFAGMLRRKSSGREY